MIRKAFQKFRTATWMELKLQAKTDELTKLTQKHTASKQDLIAPVKDMVKEDKSRKHALTLFFPLQRVTNGGLRPTTHHLQKDPKYTEQKHYAFLLFVTSWTPGTVECCALCIDAHCFVSQYRVWLGA